jgi:hypothetical protein
MTEFEKNVYGMSHAAIRVLYIESDTAKWSSLELVVMGILSDAQELMAAGHNDAARKKMNIAKFILSEMIDAKESV